MRYDLWVRPRPYQGDAFVEGPTPYDAKLSPGNIYLVLGVHDDGRMESEAYFSVVNEEGEVWFVSNRHFILEEVYVDGRITHPIRSLPTQYGY